jgi:hypothetical protein
MVVAVLIGVGFALGLIVGRWWVILACVGVGAWIGLSEELEIPGWYLGLVYAALSGLGLAAGILVRRNLTRRSF